MKAFFAWIGAVLLASAICAFGQATSTNLQSFAPAQKAALITHYVDDTKLVKLTGGTHPAATRRNDRGPVADQFILEHILLQLKRSPSQEQALRSFIDSLHDPNSPNFHKWISSDEFGRRFGIAQSDIDAVSNWLRNHGFAVNHIYPNMVIDFTGTAGQVKRAFHTEIHHLDANGQPHIANLSDPMIPAALAPAVMGVVSLHDFRPVPTSRPRTNYSLGDSWTYLVTPPDLYTIYNFTPAFTAGYKGTGQTIAIMSESNAYNSTGVSSDWNTFRNKFGIPVSSYPHASLTTIHPAPGKGGACTDPGVNGAEGEAAIDVEYSAAGAPDAAIVIATCADSATTAGLFIAMQNMLTNGTAAPNIISISYGFTESAEGTAGNAFVAGLYQLAVSDGISVFVSSGDSGADAADQNNGIDTSGINVSGFATTPYNVAVGGTDFSDNYSGTAGTYWNSTNPSNYGTAKSYVPEIPWNNSCGSTLIADYITGSTVTYGSTGLCNSTDAQTYGLINNSGGSGGPSSCATGSGSSCAGYPKPGWQSLLGVPADGVRDIPDVALFAASGMWGHAYIVCWSDTTQQGAAACTGDPGSWSGFGGTSVAAPIWAGIQALINEKTNSRWGNPNPVYYSLAKSEYGTGGSSACNSSKGNAIGSTCVFYDVTMGDNDMPCQAGSPNCYLPSGTNGVLSTSTTSYKPAYVTNTGWDFPTGIGTVNVKNLVNAFGTPVKAAMISPTPGSVLASGAVTFTWSYGSGVEVYTLYVGTSAGAHDIAFVNTGSNTSALVTTLPVNGSTVYVTLYSRINGILQSNAYTYTATGSGGSGTPASITSPANGAHLTGTSQLFQWSGGTNVTQYTLYVGTSAGTSDIAFINAHTNTSATVTTLPTDGRMIYVTLYSLINGKYYNRASTYIAAGTPAKAVITSPAKGSTITGEDATFTWNAGTGVTFYSVYVGTTAGAHDLDFSGTTHLHTYSVTNLPANGKTVYVQLNSYIDGLWQSNNYSYPNP